MGKYKSLGDLKEEIKPLPGQVWRLDDTKVIMDREEEEANSNKDRFVLIVSSFDLIKNNHIKSYNIIPLSNNAESSDIAFPIAKNYSQTSDGFTIKHILDSDFYPIAVQLTIHFHLQYLV